MVGRSGPGGAACAKGRKAAGRVRTSTAAACWACLPTPGWRTSGRPGTRAPPGGGRAWKQRSEWGLPGVGPWHTRAGPWEGGRHNRADATQLATPPTHRVSGLRFWRVTRRVGPVRRVVACPRARPSLAVAFAGGAAHGWPADGTRRRVSRAGQHVNRGCVGPGEQSKSQCHAGRRVTRTVLPLHCMRACGDVTAWLAGGPWLDRG